MHAFVACEILGNRAIRNVLDADASSCKLFHIGSKGAQVAREHASAVARKKTRDSNEQLGVVALNVKGPTAHAA